MKKLKIALCAVNTRYSQNAAALYYLSGYLYKHLDSKKIDRACYELKIYEFNLNDTHEYVTRTLCSEGADIYAFSIYIWNREYIKRLISFVRRAFDDPVTIAGGPEVISVSKGDAEAMCGAEYAIAGEGEISFARFVELALDAFNACGRAGAFDEKRLMEIEGIARESGGKFIYSSEPAVVNNLDEIPTLFERPAAASVRPEKNFVYMETSRGCPNHCHYCLSSIKPKNGPAVRYFSLERVFADIDRIVNVMKIDKVRVIDRTFNDDPGRALAIFKYIVSKSGPETMFQFEISPYKFTPEIIDYLKSLDRQYFQFEIGVQSFNKKALDSVGRAHGEGSGGPEKASGARAGDILDVLINETAVNIHADLMYGLPGDRYGDCIYSFDKLLLKMPDSVQFWQLKLLRGTKLRETAEAAGLVYDPNPPYAVIRTSDIGIFEMFRLQKLGRYLDLFYNHGHVRQTLKLLFDYFKKPSDLFFGLSEYFERNSISETAVSRQNLFLYIQKFGEEFVKAESEKKYSVFLDCLRYDFIGGESKRFSLPDFLKPARMKRDAAFYAAVQGALCGAGSRLKLSKTFSLFRFENDIVKAASGEEIARGKKTAFNMQSPSPCGAYMALRHIVNGDGTFDTQKFWFNDPGDFAALDYFYFADKNKLPVSGGDAAGDKAAQAAAGRILALVEKFVKYGIIVKQ